MTNLNLIHGILYDPLSPPGVNPECRTKNKPWTPPGMCLPKKNWFSFIQTRTTKGTWDTKAQKSSKAGIWRKFKLYAKFFYLFFFIPLKEQKCILISKFDSISQEHHRVDSI